MRKLTPKEGAREGGATVALRDVGTAMAGTGIAASTHLSPASKS